MLIRTEIGVDAAGIDGLLQRCFPTLAEAKLVHKLRRNGLLTLAMVATDSEGQIFGYAAFSPVTLNGEEVGWLGLAPIAVDEHVRGKGLGRRLIYEGLETLHEFGYNAVVVLGDPAWYQRYGFEVASRYHLYCCWPDSEAAFQVCPLNEQALAGVTGRIDYSAPFDKLSYFL